MRKSILAGLALAALVSTTGGVANADDTTVEQINASTTSAVVYLETTWSGYVYDWARDSEGQRYGWVGSKPFTTTSRCTGFVVNPNGYIVTAGHCLEYTDSVQDNLIYQAMAWERSKGLWPKSMSVNEIYKNYSDTYQAYGDEGKGKPERDVSTTLGISVSGENTVTTQPARVLDVMGFDKGDVGLVKIEAENLPALTMAPEGTVEVGTEVVSVGFPASVDAVTDATMDPSYKDGTISSVKSIQQGLLEVYEISAQMSGGMSGGPTLNADGEVVGLNSFGIVGESKGFSFIRPSSIINEMLVDQGATNEVSDVQRTYELGLDAYFEGDKVTAIDAFDTVLAQAPSHTFAQEYRAKAETLADPEPTNEGLPVLPLVLAGLGGLVLVGVVGTGVVLVVRRPRHDRQLDLTQVEERAALPVEPTSTNGARTCTECGERQQYGAKFCPNCGQAAEQVVHA